MSIPKEKVKQVDDPATQRLIADLLSQVFSSDDPFGCPFKERFKDRLIFYQTEGYHLSERQYSAVINGLKEMREQGFFVSTIEGQGPNAERGDHWWCECPAYDQYLAIPLVLENAVYSRTGRWGLLISHEDHAVVGSQNEFVEVLRRRYPQWRTDLNDLREFWSDSGDPGWIDKAVGQAEKPE